MRYISQIGIILILATGICFSADNRTHLSKIRCLIINVDSSIAIADVTKDVLEDELFWILKNEMPQIRVYKSADRPLSSGDDFETSDFRITLINSNLLNMSGNSGLPEEYMVPYYYTVRVGSDYDDTILGLVFKEYWYINGSGMVKQKDLKTGLVTEMTGIVKQFAAKWNDDNNNK
jgi:hypothetical protein